MPDETTCWTAVQNRDAAWDGRFFYGVMTTGVFCRPSCPSRPPLRRNVRFYASPAEAEADHLRACLRCRPLAAVDADPHAERIRSLCRYIEEHAAEPINLTELAARAGLSPYHLQRTFRAVAGVTPKQYQEACRMRVLKGSLRTSGDVTEAVYEAGFGSSSRVYERADTRLGMTPLEYRRGGESVAISYASMKTPIGVLMIGATDRGICFVQFGDDRKELAAQLGREYPNASISPAPEPLHADFERWMQALQQHLAGEQPSLHLPVDIRATAFQMKVWNYLQQIPYGDVRSYSEVAEAIGQPRAARAVARACASNHVALIIPCHRVIRGTGELGGYRWGLARKRVLIDEERRSRALIEAFSDPQSGAGSRALVSPQDRRRV